MGPERETRELGWRMFGLGVIALAIVGLALGDFIPGQAAPKSLPDRSAFAYAAAVFMLFAGAALEWRRTLVWASAMLTIYYSLVVVVAMDARVVFAHLDLYLAYSNLAEQLAIAAGALVVFANAARIDPAIAGRLTRIAQVTFGVCAVLFGGAHFAYMNMTAPLVPSWLPPSQEFWGYATGIAHIIAGLAILSGVQARLAAILLTVMYASFTPLVHLPMLLANPSNRMTWTENATNLVLTGVAWAVADSLARPKRTKLTP